jgi:hypothetical protein
MHYLNTAGKTANVYGWGDTFFESGSGVSMGKDLNVS